MASSSTVAASLLHAMTLAVIETSDAPIVLLDPALDIVAASQSFCDAFDVDCEAIRGGPLAAIGDGEWSTPQLHSLLTATASGLAAVAGYEMDLVRPGRPTRALQLNAHILNGRGVDAGHVMLAVTDVTDVRAAARRTDELIRDKAMLVQEMQHRVANSLQIIASVLMQSAKRVQSEETRGHLNAAHNRVMSVASVQRQLAESGTGDVRLKPYFDQLCISIGASMIHDAERLKLIVVCDASIVPASESVSLGLIVTELVINALKHAFPDERRGTITVGYDAGAGDWRLSVADDGVGMPRGATHGKAGLGSSIVEALARQLAADITVTDMASGTAVALHHAKVGRDAAQPIPILAL